MEYGRFRLGISKEETRVDLGYLLNHYLTHTLSLLNFLLILWISLSYTLYWFNIRNGLNMTEKLLTGKNRIDSNKQTFKILFVENMGM